MTQPLQNLQELRDIDRELGERLQVEPARVWDIWSPDNVEVLYRAYSEVEADTWLQHMVTADNEPLRRCRREVITTYPAFSTDGNAMLQLIELMAKRGYSCSLDWDDEWSCLFQSTEQIWKMYEETGSTGPTCVCLAARMALRAEAGE